MNIILDLVTNRILVATVAAWFVAQFLKVLFDTIKNGFSVERLTGSGGMPSSHSATVTGPVSYTHLKRDEQVLDLGTGTGIIPILLEAKTEGKHFTGLEIQPESADMASRSVCLLYTSRCV